MKRLVAVLKKPGAGQIVNSVFVNFQPNACSHRHELNYENVEIFKGYRMVLVEKLHF